MLIPPPMRAEGDAGEVARLAQRDVTEGAQGRRSGQNNHVSTFPLVSFSRNGKVSTLIPVKIAGYQRPA